MLSVQIEGYTEGKRRSDHLLWLHQQHSFTYIERTKTNHCVEGDGLMLRIFSIDHIWNENIQQRSEMKNVFGVLTK